jgi:hypothetical protein
MKNKIFNAYTYFIAGVLLVTGATFFKVECPVCDGTGRIVGVSGMEVKSIKADLVNHYELGIECGWDFEKFTYDVELTVENYRDEAAWGVILVTFHDPEESYLIRVEINDEEVDKEVTGQTLLSYPWFVQVPANTTQVFKKRVDFQGVTLQFYGGLDHLIKANLASSYPCPFHGEDATVTFPEWLKLR